MQVTVAIPTYKTRNTIFKLLDSLLAQSYKRFDVEIIFKRSSDKEADGKALDRIKDYSGLSIGLTKQRSGGIPEAMNAIFGLDSDIVINTDDDAYASENWVRDHCALHAKHRKVGILTGLVHGTEPETAALRGSINALLNSQKWRINNFAAIDPPIDRGFAEYGMYIGKSGMLVDTGRRHNMISTFKQHGVNMSWKGSAMRGLELPPYAPRGHRYEAYMALQLIRRGYKAVWFNKGKNFHDTHESSSRGANVASIPAETILTDVLFSYYVSKFYDVDLSRLRARATLGSVIAGLVAPARKQCYSRGYEIAHDAITNNWTPQRVRKTLLAELAKMGLK